MATRYAINNIQNGIENTVHETGHAVYEQVRNKANIDLPVSMALSLGIHESQSLPWERMFYNGVKRVQPGFIRIESDEITYPMHVILRYEIKKALIEGDIQVAD
ncbi:hypothetical protein BGX24_007788, partial [Mortierella sp. AD032]